MRLRWWRALAIVPVLIAGQAYAQGAAPARKLRVGDSFPIGHYLVRYVLQPWMDEVARRTNGRSRSTTTPRSNSARRPIFWR